MLAVVLEETTPDLLAERQATTPQHQAAQRQHLREPGPSVRGREGGVGRQDRNGRCSGGGEIEMDVAVGGESDDIAVGDIVMM